MIGWRDVIDTGGRGFAVEGLGASSPYLSRRTGAGTGRKQGVLSTTCSLLFHDFVKKHLDGISGSAPIPISHRLIFLISGPLKLAAASSVQSTNLCNTHRT